MAVEAILEPSERSDVVQSHVRSLISQTRESELPQDEKQSICGSLDWLFRDSIGRSGRKLAESLLAGKTYNGKAAGKFFEQCYSIRSKLVHEGNSGRGQKPEELITELNSFVRDLVIAAMQEAN
ncbi:hypothetical protein CA12_32030 [Alienimonas californiensis]|uniref:Apea-like HEPN domain-containing protein n=2 Tax=Alienimonas californiensis TaxID=2527989 RepID=A0A517PCM6_9PLAN|nr:hypothetical protein CA12_32030 [Alienimonas californiensis]